MRRVSAAGLAALAALAACATAGEPLPPAPPPSFRAVKSLVLVRTAEGRAGRARDPLDGLDDSLRARGYLTRLVELGSRRKPEEAPLERLFVQLEARAAAARQDRLGAAPFGDAGRAAGAAVAELGVDAVATYHRLDGRRTFPPASGEPGLPGTVMPGPPVAPGRGALGALALVDREGHVATFPWGDPGGFEDPGTPVNAAEAIDLLLRTLTGEAPDG